MIKESFPLTPGNSVSITQENDLAKCCLPGEYFITLLWAVGVSVLS